MKKILSAALALVLAMALAVSAFAAYEPALELGLFVGGTDQYAPSDATITVTEPGRYTISTTTNTGDVWIIFKSTGADCTSSVPAGTIIKTEEIKVNGEALEITDPAVAEYVVGENGKIEIMYVMSWWGVNALANLPAGAPESVEITFVVDPDAVADEPAEEPAPEAEAPAAEATGETVIASADMTASGNLTVLDGADFTNPDLFLNIYYDVVNEANIGWGPGSICDKNWTTIIDNNYAACSLAVEASGKYTIALTEIADAFAAANADPAEGLILNWWADYATLTKVELVTTGAAPEAPAEEPAPEVDEPAEEPAPEVDEPAEDETPATEAPAETGVAFALIPAVIAMAVVAFKKR